MVTATGKLLAGAWHLIATSPAELAQRESRELSILHSSYRVRFKVVRVCLSIRHNAHCFPAHRHIRSACRRGSAGLRSQAYSLTERAFVHGMREHSDKKKQRAHGFACLHRVHLEPETDARQLFVMCVCFFSTVERRLGMRV